MFKPLNGRILVSPDKVKDETDFGLVLAEKIQEKPATGVVVSGDDDFQVGDKILFSKYGYDEVTIKKELYYVVASKNILGIFT